MRKISGTVRNVLDSDERGLSEFNHREYLSAHCSSIMATSITGIFNTFITACMVIHTELHYLLDIYIYIYIYMSSHSPWMQKKIFGLGSSGKSMFRCLDSSESIAIERVNDDFCDCKDGSGGSK